MSSSDQVRTYSRAESVVFLKTDEPFGGLSNMAGGYPIRVNGIRILTSEALYQACRFPHLPDVQRMIIGENSPMTAKMRSKPYRKDSRQDWDRVRVRIMRWSLRMKLASNWSAFSELLLRTDDCPIVEQSRKDDFWGAKPVGDGSTLVGMNVLGRLLMELREQVKEHGRDAFLRVELPGIPDFQLLGRPIEVWALKAAQHGTAVMPMPQAGLFGDDLPSDQAVATDTASARLRTDSGEQRSEPVALPMEAEPGSDTQAHPGAVSDQVTIYANYQESGLPWAPKIPEGWQVLRNGRLFSHRVETGFPELPILEVSLRTGVRVRDMENLKRKQVMSQKEKYKRAAKGDIAYNMMRMWQGAVGPAPVDGLVSPAYVVVKPYPEANSVYFSYQFRTSAYMREVNKFSRGIVADRNRLYWESFKQMPSLVPPRPEQEQIVAYLRAQDAHVVRFIKTKRDLIALLEEQRRAVIRRAVSNGDAGGRAIVNPDFWFGSAPGHWKIKKLKHLVRFLGGGTPSKAVDTYWSGSIPWVSPKDMRTDEIIDSQDHISEQALRESVVQMVPSGAVLVVVRSGILRRRIPVAINAVPVTLNQDMKALVSRGEITAPYLRYLIEGYQQSLLLAWSKVGATVESLEHGYVANSLVPVPPVQEQRAICERLDDDLRGIGEAIEREKQTIALMLEYRGRLIADVVTGQIDVRSWKPGPDDVANEDELAALGDDEAGSTEEEEVDGDN